MPKKENAEAKHVNAKFIRCGTTYGELLLERERERKVLTTQRLIFFLAGGVEMQFGLCLGG